MKRRSRITHRETTRDYFGPVYFAAIAIAAWGPALFANGYVLLGDMVFTPAMHPPNSLLSPSFSTMNVTLIYGIAWVLSRAIGAVLLQKAILFLLAFLSGYLMYRKAPVRQRAARLFAGTLYAVNPFVYTRMLMGQWGLLLGYALLPVALASTLDTVREPTVGRCARTALWIAGIALLSLHMGAVALLACALAGVFQLAALRGRGKAAAALVVVLVLFLLLGALWIVPAVKGNVAASFGKADLKVFETRSTSQAGTALSVVGMYGYWKTQIDALMPRGWVPLWPVVAVGLVLLSLFGFWSYRGDPTRGPLAWAMLVLGIAGFFLALGVKAPLAGSLFSFVYNHVPAFRLFREPQKFVALLALSYALLGGLGVERLVTRRSPEPGRREQWRRVLPALLIVLVLLYSFRMFGGLWGEAKAVTYPRSWDQARQVLDNDKGDWNAIYLPPYWYMRFDFTKNRQTITSPMPFYFTNRYVQLNALMVGPVKLGQQPVDSYIETSLESARENGNLGAMLSPLNVRYVLMPLNTASEHFRFVERQNDLEVVKRWNDLVLLRNKVPTSSLQLAARTGSYTDWSEVGAQARGGNLLGSYLRKGASTDIPAARAEPIPHSTARSGAVTATLPPSSGNSSTLLFAEPYDDGWRMEGAGDPRPMKQLGIVTAFQLAAGATGERAVTIRYRNTRLLVGYSVSAAALLLCVILILAEIMSKMRKRKA